MENLLIRKTAKKLTYFMNTYAKYESCQLRKLQYGIEILIVNISKVVILYLSAIMLGVIWQTLCVHLSFLTIKRYSYGLHALNSTICTLLGIVTFVVVPFFLMDAGISNFVTLLAFLGIFCALLLYAPADTKAKPLVGCELRRWLKKRSVICALVLLIIALVVHCENVKLLIVLGAAYQCLSILPLTYKLLKRSERNYEKHDSL